MTDPQALDLSFLPLKFSRNKLSHNIDAANPALVSRVGLKYYLTISIPEYPFSEIFEELHTSEGREKPVDNQGGVEIYAGAEFRYNSGRNGKIDGLLTYTKPRWKQNVLTAILSQTTAYFLTEDVAGGTPAVATTNALGKMYAIKAGLANEDFYAYGESFWKTHQATARQFLTWQPNYKRTNREQEEYLYFLMNFTPKPTTVKLRAQWFTATGDPSEAVTAMTMSNPLLYSVICCPVGAAVLGIPDQAVRYEVWLSNENDKRLSEVRTFHLDRAANYERSVIFVNSLGGWDTLRLTGQGQRSLKVRQSVAEMDRPAEAAADFSELKIIAVEGEYELAVSTGYFKRDAAAYLKYLDELLLSDELYLITEKGHRPLQLTSSAMVDEMDNADLIARNFTFRILDTIENFSNLPATEPVAERPTAWRGLGLRYVLDGNGKRTGLVEFTRLKKVYSDNETEVKPYTTKSNTPGDPDYIPPLTDTSTIPGSTPYPNTVVTKPGSFNRSNCAPGYLGGPAVVTVPAGTYGGESPGDANQLAEAASITMDTQAYADANGTCALNNVPVRLALRHEIPMTGGLVIANGKEGPRVNAFWDGQSWFGPYVGDAPPVTVVFESTVLPGTRTLGVYVLYGGPDLQPCKIRIDSKNREILCAESGLYIFDNVTVNSTDEPLTIKITMP